MIKLTDEMLQAANHAYDAQASHSEGLWCALRAVLSMVPEPVTGETAAVPVMTRAEALLKAQEMVDGWATASPDRARSLGGTVGHSLDDRTTAVLRLAAFLINTSEPV